MKKLTPKQIAALAALTVGALVVGKIAKDIKKVCQMANEKEETLPNTNEEIASVEGEVVEEAPAQEEAPAAEEEIIEIAEATEAEATETITE